MATKIKLYSTEADQKLKNLIILPNGELSSNRLDNTSGSGAPTVNDDEAAGYSALSFWRDVVEDPPLIYICADPTEGAAIWVNISVLPL